ncbi:MAG: hypothetical protein WD557_03245 [Dehalococcoidia bacterium]
MGRMLAGFAVVLLVALAVACEEQEPEPSSGEVTLEAAVAAMEREGMVFHAEWEFPPDGDQLSRMKAWHWPERELVRTEFHDQDAHRSTTIASRQGEVSYHPDDGSLRDDRDSGTQWDPRLGMAGIFPHISYWRIAQDRTVIGAETLGGRTVTHVRAVFTAEEDAHERPKGTTYTSDIFLDAESLLPVTVTILIEYPTQEGDSQPGTFTYVKTEFVDPDSLPPGFFDQDRLAVEEVTFDEAIEFAANQPFEAFWLGREIEVPWDTPDGTHHESIPLGSVTAPGMPRGRANMVSARYSPPPDSASSPLAVDSSGDPLFTGIPRGDMEMLQRTGSTSPLADGSGFIYWRYIPAKPCTPEQAQLDAACRQFPEPTYGVLLHRDGTTIHISLATLTSRDGDNLNPFNDPDLLERLAGELRPFGQ